MLILTAALSFALAQVNAAPVLSDIGKRKAIGSCRMATPEQCARSGEWITDDPRFEPAVIDFLKSVRDRFGYTNQPAWEVFMRTIDGPHVNPDRIAPGTYLFSACLMHHCPGREVAVLIGRGRVLGVAMKGDVCNRCGRAMYIFVKRSETSSQRWINTLARWGGYGSQSHVVFLP